MHGGRPVPRRSPARRRPVQRHRGVDHRLQRGGDAGWAGLEMALARKGRQRLGEAHPQPGDGLQRPGGVGEVLPLLRRRTALSADGGGALRHHSRAGRRCRRRKHHRGGRDPGHHLHRRTRADRRDLRGAGQTGRGRRRGCPGARRRGQRRVRGAVPAPRAEVGFPAAPGGVDQRQRAQIRADLPRHRLRGVARARSTCPRTWSSTSTTSAATCRPSP